MVIKRVSFVLFAVLLLLVSCVPVPTPTQPPTGQPTPTQSLAKEAVTSVKDLVNQHWVLESFGPLGSEKTALLGTEVSVQFTQDGKLNGSGGCNHYFAAYKAGEGNTLSIGPVGSTLMACLDQGVMEQEQQYFKALGEVSAFTVDQNRLQLFYNDGQGVLNFTVVNAGLANPASVYCGEHGGKLEIRDEAGGQAGYCIFPDGSECEEWAFFRGECKPGEPKVGLANPASVYCGEHGGKLEIRDEAGGQAGYCIFPDGSECEEWAFFRGECKPGG